MKPPVAEGQRPESQPYSFSISLLGRKVATQALDELLRSLTHGFAVNVAAVLRDDEVGAVATSPHCSADIRVLWSLKRDTTVWLGHIGKWWYSRTSTRLD